MPSQEPPAVGRYELRGQLGAGGMGVLWRAFDPDLQREVALKQIRLPAQFDDTERAEAHARMEREAQAAARVSHPGVVPVHDVVRTGSGPWIVMALLSGRSLQQRLEETGPLEPPAALAVARGVLEALAAAHAAGVVHRDVKPANIMLCADGRTVLTDFGIASVVDSGTALTRTGTFIGSPEYMAPERFDDGPAVPASDLWSLGAVVHAALTGASPFRRDTVTAVIAAVVAKPLPEPPAAEPPLPRLVAELLNRDPRLRPTPEQALRMLDDAGAAARAHGDGHGSGAPAQSRGDRAGATVPAPPAATAQPESAAPPPVPPEAPEDGGPDAGAPPEPRPAAAGPDEPTAVVGGAAPTRVHSARLPMLPPLPDPPPPRRTGVSRRRMLGIGAGAGAAAVAAGLGVWAYAANRTRYVTYEHAHFTIRVPEGWDIIHAQDPDEEGWAGDVLAEAFAVEPAGDAEAHLFVVRLDIDDADSMADMARIERHNRDAAEGVSDWERIEMEEDHSRGASAAYMAATLKADVWRIDRRYYYVHQMVDHDDRLFRIVVNCPADEQQSYEGIRDTLVDSFLEA